MRFATISRRHWPISGGTCQIPSFRTVRRFAGIVTTNLDLDRVQPNLNSKGQATLEIQRVSPIVPPIQAVAHKGSDTDEVHERSCTIEALAKWESEIRFDFQVVALVDID